MSNSKDTVSSKNVSRRVNVHNLRTVINKRKFDDEDDDDEDNKMTRKRQNLNSMKTSNLFFPDLLVPFVCQKSVQNVLNIRRGRDCTNLEEIKSAEKINLVFEVCEMKLFPENDVLIFKIRDGTICPKRLLSIPLFENWTQLQEKVLYSQVYISDQPIVELVLYNSSFTPNLKERSVYSMKNIMIVETVKNKGLMLCANGRDTRTLKLRSNSECMKTISRRTSTSSYQKAEEEHLKKMSYLYLIYYNIHWNSKHNNSSLKSQENLKNDKKSKNVEDRKMEKSAVLSKLSSEKNDSDREKMSREHFQQNITIRKKKLKKRCSSSESLTESSSESFKLIYSYKTRNKIASEGKMNSNRKHLSNLKSSKNLDTNDSMNKVKKLNSSQADSKSSSDTSFSEFINSSSSEVVSTTLEVSEIENNTTNTIKMYKSDCVMSPKKHNSLRSSSSYKRKIYKKLLSSSSEESFESNDVPRIEKNSFSKSENHNKSIKKKNMKKLLFEDNSESQNDVKVDSRNKSITGIKIKSTDEHNNCSKSKKIQSTEAGYKENENPIKNDKTEDGAKAVNIENQGTNISLLNINNQNKLSTSNDDLLPSTSSLKSGNKSENVEEIETTPHLDSEESRKNDLIVNNDERRKTKNVEKTHFDSSSTDSFFKKCTKSGKNKIEKTKENFDCRRKNKLKIGDDNNDINAENKDLGISLRKSNRNDSTSNTSLTPQTSISPSCLEKKHKNSKVDANTSLTPQTSISPSCLEKKHKHSKVDANTSLTPQTSISPSCLEEKHKHSKVDANTSLTPQTSISPSCLEKKHKNSKEDVNTSSSEKRNKHENSKVELVSTDPQSNHSSDKYLKIFNQIVNTKKQRPSCVVSDKNIKLVETDLKDKSNKEKKEKLQSQHLLNESNTEKKDTTSRSKVIVQINEEEMCSNFSENNSHRLEPNEYLESKYKTLSQLQPRTSNANIFGVIVEILKEKTPTNSFGNKLSLNIVDDTQYDTPFRVNLFLNASSLIKLNCVLREKQIVELNNLRVDKFGSHLMGRIYAPSSIKLYDSSSFEEINWPQPLLKKENQLTVSGAIIINKLKNLLKTKFGMSMETPSTQSESPNIIFKMEKQIISERLKNGNKKNKKMSPLKTDLISNLERIVAKNPLTELRTSRINKSNFSSFQEITEECKVNIVAEVVNIHRFNETNLSIIQVRKDTALSFPILQVPFVDSWADAKEQILNDPSFKIDSKFVDILCFDSHPYLPPMKINDSLYGFHNILFIKTHKIGSNKKKVGYLACVEGKDCEIEKKKSAYGKSEIHQKKDAKEKTCDSKKSLSIENHKNNKSDQSNTSENHNSIEKASNCESESIVSSETLIEGMKNSWAKVICKRLFPDVNIMKLMLPSSEDSLDRAMRSLPIPNPEKVNINKEVATSKELDQSNNESTPSIRDMKSSEDLTPDLPQGIINEINSILDEASAVDLPIDSYDLNIIQSAPTYSEFLENANERSILGKTSTQNLEVEEMSFINQENNNIEDKSQDSYNFSLIYGSDSENEEITNKDNEEITNKKDNEEITKKKDNEEITNKKDNEEITNKKDNEAITNKKQDVKVGHNPDNSKTGSLFILTEKAVGSSKCKNSTQDRNLPSSITEDNTSKTDETVCETIFNTKLLLKNSATSLLLIDAVKEGYKHPSHHFHDSQSTEEEDSDEEESDDESVQSNESCSDKPYETDMPNPKLPVIDFTTYEELQRTNCCTYTTQPSKMIRPLLEDGFEEKAIKCTCSCCNETFALSDLEKVLSNDDSGWPNKQVPVCPTPNCKRRPIEYKNAVFHFLMQLHLSRTEEVVEAILEGTSAELYLGFKVHDFLESKEKQHYVKFLLENLFQQHEGTYYTFLLSRKDIFDPDSGPIYIKKIS